MAKSNNNMVSINGNLTRDIEMKYATSGSAVGKFSIANNQNKKVGDNWETVGHFFDCVLFGKRAEALQQYMTKGQAVSILGHLEQNRWQDKETGKNRSSVQIIVDDIELTGGKPQSGGSSPDSFQDDDDWG